MLSCPMRDSSGVVDRLLHVMYVVFASIFTVLLERDYQCPPSAYSTLSIAPKILECLVDFGPGKSSL